MTMSMWFHRPNHKTGIKNRYLQGIGKVENDVILLLDCKKLFDEGEEQEILEAESR